MLSQEAELVPYILFMPYFDMHSYTDYLNDLGWPQKTQLVSTRMFVKIWGQVTTTLLISVSLPVPKSNNSSSSCSGNEAFSNMKLITLFVRPFEAAVVFSTSKVCHSSDQIWICLSTWDNFLKVISNLSLFKRVDCFPVKF